MAAKELLEKLYEQETHTHTLLKFKIHPHDFVPDIRIKILDIVYVSDRDTYFVSYVYGVTTYDKTVIYKSFKNGKSTVDLNNILDKYMTYDMSDLMNSKKSTCAGLFTHLLSEHLGEFKSTVMSVSDLYVLPKEI